MERLQPFSHALESTTIGRHEAAVERALFVSGVILVLGGVGWEFFIRELVGGYRSYTPSGVASAALAYLFARSATRRNRMLVPGVLVGAALCFAVVRLGVLFGRPSPAPLGYSNAAGSFFMVAAGAALLLVARANAISVGSIGVLAACGFATVPLLNHTAAATILLALLPLSLLAHDLKGIRTVILVSGCAVLVTLAMAITLALLYGPASTHDFLRPLLESTISERRVLLWREALQMIAAHPLTGVGPSGFGMRSTFATWPHNEILHAGADTGLGGSILLLGLLAWGFARLWWGAADRGTAVAAAVLGAVGVHSNIDYVLHYPVIGMAAAALVGAGSIVSGRPHRGSRAEREEFAPGHAVKTRAADADRSRVPSVCGTPQWDILRHCFKRATHCGRRAPYRRRSDAARDSSKHGLWRAASEIPCP